MRHRSARPFAPSPKRDPLARDRQVRVWLERMVGEAGADPSRVDPALLQFVLDEVSRRRHASGTTAATLLERQIHDSFLKHTERYWPVMAAPELDDEMEDLRLVLTLPRMQRLWCEWPDPVRASRGPAPRWAAAKAVLVVFGMTEAGDLEEAYNRLTHRSALREAFESLDRLRAGRAAPSLPGLGVSAAELPMPAYTTVARQLPLVAETLLGVIDAARVDMLRELASLFPSAPIGEVWSLDGTHRPWWIPQRGYKEDDPRERQLRARAPEARFRAWTKDKKGPGGKKTVAQSDTVKVAAFAKKWRGSYEIPMVELVTGLPGPRISQTDNEHFAVVPLLSDLHRLWPGVPFGVLAGDSAFDIAAVNRLLVTSYGALGCFVLHDERGDQPFEKGISRDGSVWGTTSKGRLICGTCRRPMDTTALELFPRNYTVDGKVQRDADGNKQLLYPGVENEPNRHRIRAVCADHGRLGVSMAANWKLLGCLPHYPEGRADLYGKRLAIMARRSLIESYHSRLKTARRLATEGADRIRHNDQRTMNALLELAATSFVAQQLYDERRERGMPASFGLPATGVTAPPTTTMRASQTDA